MLETHRRSDIIFDPKAPYIRRFKLQGNYRMDRNRNGENQNSISYDLSVNFVIKNFKIQPPNFLENISVTNRNSLRNFGGLTRVLEINKKRRHTNTLINNLGEFDEFRRWLIVEQTKEAITKCDYCDRNSSDTFQSIVGVIDPNTKLAMICRIEGNWSENGRIFTLNSLAIDRVSDDKEEVKNHLIDYDIVYPETPKLKSQEFGDFLGKTQSGAQTSVNTWI